MSPPRPRSRDALVTAGIFLIFGQVGIFIALIQPEPAGWLFTLLLWCLSGLMAMGWAIMFQRRGLWFTLTAPLVIVPVLVFPWMFDQLFKAGLLGVGYDWAPAARQIFAIVLGTLSLSLGFILVIQHIVRAERRAARDRAELELAAQVHATLVPSIEFRAAGIAVFARSDPSSAMGGDLVDAIAVGDRDEDGNPPTPRIDAMLADVSGHGLAAGIVMAMVKAAVRTRLGAPADPGLLAADLNRVLCALTTPGMFVTGAWVRAEPQGRWTLALAGHLPAMLRRADTGRVERIENQSLPLAIDPGERFPVQTIDARPGDTLLLVTDGLTEAMDADGRQLGLDAIEARFSAIGDAADLAAIDRALRELVEPRGPAADDRSVLLIRRDA